MGAVDPSRSRATRHPGANSSAAALPRARASRSLRRKCFVHLGPRRVMLFCPFQYFVVWSWLILEVIRLHIVFPHRMIFEFVPHQDPTQVGMTFEMDAVEVVDFAFLQFRRPVERRQ